MNIVKRNVKARAVVNSSIERHPVPVLGVDYKVKIVYKNIKITELDVENKTIKISLPNKYKKMSNKEILDLAIEKMYEQIANVEIERAMEKTRIMLNGEGLGFLIGYRGETLYAMQNIISSIAGKGIQNRIRVILDIEGYKEKREKTLEDLAEKVAKTVIKTKKSVKLEPMQEI